MREGPLADLFRSTDRRPASRPARGAPPRERAIQAERRRGARSGRARAPVRPRRTRPRSRGPRPRRRASPTPEPPARAAARARSPTRAGAGPAAEQRRDPMAPPERDADASTLPKPKERLQQDLRRRAPRATCSRRRATAARSRPTSRRARRAAHAGDPRRRRRRRRRQRRQPDGRGADPRGRVHGRQHRPSVAAALHRRRHRPHRRRADARPRRRLRPRARPPVGLRGAGQDQAPAEGLRHGLRRRRRRRRHRHRRRPGDRPPRPRGRRADGRHRHQAVQLRGQPRAATRPTRASRRWPPRSTP